MSRNLKVNVDVKLEIVKRALNGEAYLKLAQEYFPTCNKESKSGSIRKWVKSYQNGGIELLGKSAGRSVSIANRVKVDKGVYLNGGKSFDLTGKSKIEQKEHLRAMQMTFWSEVASGFGIEKPIEQSKETKKEHLSEISFKRQQIANDILKNQNKLFEIKNVMKKVELSKARSMNYLNSIKSEALLSEIEKIMTQDNNQKYFKKVKEQAIKKILKITNILER